MSLYERASIYTLRSEVVNGYNLLARNDNIMSEKAFKSLKSMSMCPDVPDKLFLNWFNENATIRWGAMDTRGNILDFPQIDEVTDRNIVALMNLPFKRYMLLFAIEFGQNQYMESVRFCNFFCEWFYRKNAAMQSLRIVDRWENMYKHIKEHERIKRKMHPQGEFMKRIIEIDEDLH